MRLKMRRFLHLVGISLVGWCYGVIADDASGGRGVAAGHKMHHDHDDLMDDVMAECVAEAALERAEDETIRRDAHEATAAKHHASASSASEPPPGHKQQQQQQHQHQPNKGFHRPSTGAASMSEKRARRESVSAATDRSRVPKSSQTGGSGFGSGFGSSAVGDPSFSELNDRMRSASWGRDHDEEEPEPDRRRSARLALDGTTRKKQRQVVEAVFRASGVPTPRDMAGGGSGGGGEGISRGGERDDGDYEHGRAVVVGARVGDGGDWYKVLGLKRGGGGGDPSVVSTRVKAAYRARALLVHPDKNLDRNAAAAFTLLQEAYAALSTTAARQAYDRVLVKRGKVLQGTPFHKTKRTTRCQRWFDIENSAIFAP